MREIKLGDKVYIVLSVEFRPNDYKTYYYTTDDDSIEPGDFIIVPAGIQNEETPVRVVKKEYFFKDNLPMEYEKIKSVIRKSDNGWERDENIEKMMWDSFGKNIELNKYSGLFVRIICKTGNIFEGLAYDYIPPQDNEPEEASITIGFIEIYESEIERIEKLT